MIMWAKVTTRFEGFHHWPDAPEEVSFLSHPHRHEFHVTVWVEQRHSERDIEYIQLKRLLNRFLGAMDTPIDASCETIATFILEWLRNLVSPPSSVVPIRPRKVMVEVTEDGENGALLEA